MYEITAPLIQESLDDTNDMDVDSAVGGISSKLLYVLLNLVFKGAGSSY